MATQKETTIFEFQVEQGDALAEMDKTKKSIIQLKEEQAKLNKAYKDGQLTVEEYAQESVRVEQVLKKQTKSYSDLTHELQGTKSMTDQLKGGFQGISAGLNKMAPGLGGAIDGLKGLTLQSLKFIATPIGAIIAAIVTALAALTQYFRGSQEGQDKLNKIMNIGSAIMGKLSDALHDLGKFIFENIIKGFEFLGGLLSRIIPGFDELTKKVEAFLNLDNASTISAMEEQQRFLQLQLITKRDQLKADIEAAKLRGESTKNEKERAAAFSEVESKVRELFDSEKELATLERDIAIARGKLANNTFEDNVKIEEAKARLFQLEREESAMLKENATKQLALNEEKKKEIELIKAKEEAQAIAQAQAVIEAEFEQQQRELREEEALSDQARKELDAEFLMNIENSIADNEIENQERIEANFDAATQRRMANYSMIAKMRTDLVKQGLTEEQAALKVHQIIEDQKLSATSSTLGASKVLFKEHTVAYKVLASAQTIIDTYQGATAAFRSMSSIPVIGPALGAIAAAAAIALGLTNLGKINSVSAAGGAKFTTRGPTLLLVGDNPGGREHVQVTPLSGRGQTRSFGQNAFAMAGGGSIDVNGSIVASQRTNQIDSQFAIQDQLANQPPVILDFQEFTNFQQRLQFKEQLTTG